MDLVIMAAGMGSRYGGLKQIEKVDSEGNFIIDYSIYDAIKAGFDRVVFIIREDFADAFKSTIGKRVEKFIDVAYVYQKNNNLPAGAYVPETRKKPLGTAHAILCAKDVVGKHKFAILNSDDFYGEDAFKTIAKFLRSNNDKNTYGLVGYKVKNTLSESGSVKRGVLDFDNEGNLKQITESIISRDDNKLIAESISNTRYDVDPVRVIDPNTLVSMNMIGFMPSIFTELEEKFEEFFYFNGENMDKAEFLIPDVLECLIRENKAKVKVPETTAQWQGLTYKEDLPALQAQLKKLNYPKPLWNKENTLN